MTSLYSTFLSHPPNLPDMAALAFALLLAQTAAVKTHSHIVHLYSKDFGLQGNLIGCKGGDNFKYTRRIPLPIFKKVFLANLILLKGAYLSVN